MRSTALLLILSASVVAAYDAQPPDCKELKIGEEYIHPGEDVLVSTRICLPVSRSSSLIIF
jgi:hypothetical protein